MSQPVRIDSTAAATAAVKVLFAIERRGSMNVAEVQAHAAWAEAWLRVAEVLGKDGVITFTPDARP